MICLTHAFFLTLPFARKLCFFAGLCGKVTWRGAGALLGPTSIMSGKVFVDNVHQERIRLALRRHRVLWYGSYVNPMRFTPEN